MSKRIIVIDDDPLIRMLVTDCLAAFGHHVEAIGSPVQGVEKVLSDPPDILIVDLQMPEMSGVEVVERIAQSEQHSKMCVLMLSANSDMAGSMKVKRIDKFLMKPFNLQELLSAVESVESLRN